MTVLIVVPVLDEALTIGRVVAAARAYGPVLVVDDGSRDGSAAAAEAAGDEARGIEREVLDLFHPDRLAARHAAMLEAASACADSPARWSAAVGAVALRRAAARVAAICRDAQQRGTPGALLATLAAPVALPLLLVQALTGERGPDLVGPLVDVVYGGGGRAARGVE